MPSVIERCPNCYSTNIEVEPEYMRCKSCGNHGNYQIWQLCKKIPIFDAVKEEMLYTVKEQLYKHKDTWYVLAGYTSGCGRVVTGPFCRECRAFLPELTEAKKRRGKASVREDGKAAAAGDG